MTCRQRTWAIALDAAVILPLLGALLGPTSGRGATASLSTGLGLLATSIMAVTVVLVSRVRGLTRLLGLELSNDLHRRLGVAVLVLTLAHVLTAMIASPRGFGVVDSASFTPEFVSGGIAILLLGVLATRAVPRTSYRFYGVVARAHALLAVAVLVFVAAHVLFLGHLAGRPSVAVPLGMLALLVVGVLAWRWVLAPRRGRGAYLVRGVRDESPGTSTIVLMPAGFGRAPRAEPGQFVWLRRRRDVALCVEHPFTVAASSKGGLLELTVRTRGAFTRELCDLPPGAPVWVDGPHGSLVPASAKAGRFDAAGHGIVLIAGGVGITPIMSILRAHAADGDPRAHRLLLAQRPGERLFAIELGSLSRRLDLAVTHTHGRRLDVGLLGELVPASGREHDEYFVCGPPRLVSAALDVLDVLGVPDERIRTEQFG